MHHSPASVKTKGALFLDLCIVVATLGSVLFFQYGKGVLPCPMCFEERWAYWVTLPLLAMSWLVWHRLSHGVRVAMLVVVVLAFGANALFGLYHAGVEQGWWPGPSSCTGTGMGVGGSLQDALAHIRVVPCDRATILIFGLSLAAWNALVSAFLAVHSVLSIRTLANGRVDDASLAIAAATGNPRAF